MDFNDISNPTNPMNPINPLNPNSMIWDDDDISTSTTPPTRDVGELPPVVGVVSVILVLAVAVFIFKDMFGRRR